MNRRISVCLGEAKTPIGTLVYETNGNRENSMFAYHGEWLASTERFAVSPDLPLQTGMIFRAKAKHGSVFFDCFADTEPDGWGKRVILRDHAKHRKQESGTVIDSQPLNSLDYLLAVDDISRIGALRLFNDSGIPLSPCATQDMMELWRRMVFNIFVTNVDDHLNNHGFLHRGHGQWTLSPAFDLNPFPDKQRELKTWISEDTGSSGSITDCLGVGRYFGLAKSEAVQVLKDVVTAVQDWRKAAVHAGMSKLEADKFESAFEHEELARALSIVSR